ncbi:MAG: ABC transporter permease [Bacteroidota bacterium]
MIRNYLKVAYRSLSRNRGYTVINILGLAIGIAFSCMMYVYINNELSADQFHSKSSHTYRLTLTDKRVPDQWRKFGSVPPPLAKAMAEEFPEVLEQVRLYQFSGQVVFAIDGVNYQEREWFSAQPNFFDVFEFDFVSGDPGTALYEPYSLVLNETTASRLFPNQNPIGKVLKDTNYGTLKITGVVRDLPENSHIQFNMLLSQVLTGDNWTQFQGNWGSLGAYSYVVLQPGANIRALEEKLPEFQSKYFGPLAEVFETGFQPVEDIYFGSGDMEFTIEQHHGQLSYIYIFATMGLFILMIACINYINLATSKAAYRSKEIGIRKVVGAFKTQLIGQFLTESFMVTLVAMILAIGIMDLAFPFFNNITGKAFDLNLASLSRYIGPLALIGFVIAILSGSYPAFYLSRLRPVSSLKGGEVGSSRSGSLRRILVTFQFVLTIVMLVSTFLIARQLDYIQSKDVGFDKDKLLVIDINSGNVRRQFQSMKNDYEAIPGVESVGVSSRVPGEWKNINELFIRPATHDWEATDSLRTYFMGFDEGMLETFQFEMVAGRYFANNSEDSTHVIINENAAASLGLTDPVGHRLRVSRDEGPVDVTVVGVMKDFNFQSLHNKISPIMLGTWDNPFRAIDYFTLKVSGNIQQVLTAASEVHEKFDTATPMEFHFLDKQLETFYVEEQRAGMIFKMAAFLCIFVACLGLLGLASFMVEKRKKELGIRKILGANELGLFYLLSAAIGKQVGIAFLIASPLAWYIMSSWLEAFEYRVNFGVGVFIASGLIALSIALLTISYRALKAIHSNPVDSLRQE